MDTALRAAILPHLVQFKAPARTDHVERANKFVEISERFHSCLLGITLQGQRRPQLVLDQSCGSFASHVTTWPAGRAVPLWRRLQYDGSAAGRALRLWAASRR